MVKARALLFHCIGLMFASLLLTVSSASAQEKQSISDLLPAIAFVARLVGDDKRARYLIDFDREVKADIYLIDNPRRLIIDLPQTIFSLDTESTQSPSSLAQSVSYEVRRNRDARIVIDLNQPVAIDDISQKQVRGTERNRLIVDLVLSTEGRFQQSVRSRLEQKAREVNIAVPLPKAVDRKVLVLDPGHGGIDGGAVGRRKIIEKNITLSFAQKLKAEFEAGGQVDVILTRNSDTFVSLRDRFELAREKQADLMISIHADSLRQRYVRGATIYTLSKTGSDAISRQLALDQNKADLVAGLALPSGNQDVTDILIDLTRRETEVFSRRFANVLVTQMQGKIHLIKNPTRSANFFVLKAPEVPSVLMELGYLSNAEDEKLMATEEWQNKAAQLTAKAIRRFFDVAEKPDAGP